MSIDSNELNRLLHKIGACAEAVEWAKPYSLGEAWTICKRADWMLWLAGKMSDESGWSTRKEVVLAACACARTSLRFIKKTETRPLVAIETAERWARGEATFEEASSAAAYAAYAASNAAAYAASNAADAAYVEMAHLVRKFIPILHHEKAGKQ